ncbi:MAG: hypothetical protein ACT4O9_10485 [Blastocatellia bacterium]
MNKNILRTLLATVFIASAAAIGSANVPQTIFAPDPAYSTGNLIFADTLAMNESKTISVKANEPYNYTGIKAIEGQKYKFTVASPGWNNGFKETDADGYNDTGPYANTRRHTQYKTMALVVEFFSQDRNPLAYMNRKMLIGLGPREWKASVTGYMVALANDCMSCYADNSRVVTLTVKRIPA